jgi:hypothetical protein
MSDMWWVQPQDPILPQVWKASFAMDKNEYKDVNDEVVETCSGVAFMAG